MLPLPIADRIKEYQDRSGLYLSVDELPFLKDKHQQFQGHIAPTTPAILSANPSQTELNVATNPLERVA
jgi:hypothetical protein